MAYTYRYTQQIANSLLIIHYNDIRFVYGSILLNIDYGVLFVFSVVFNLFHFVWRSKDGFAYKFDYLSLALPSLFVKNKQTKMELKLQYVRFKQLQLTCTYIEAQQVMCSEHVQGQVHPHRVLCIIQMYHIKCFIMYPVDVRMWSEGVMDVAPKQVLKASRRTCISSDAFPLLTWLITPFKTPHYAEFPRLPSDQKDALIIVCTDGNKSNKFKWL